MTREELTKIPFEFVEHWNMADKYVSIYRNKEYGISIHQVTKRKDGFATGRSKRILFYKGKECKSVDELLEAINNNDE